MRERYLREREALQRREGDMIDITAYGAAGREFIDNSPTADEYVALARRAYVSGDLDLAEFESELDTLLSGDARG